MGCFGGVVVHSAPYAALERVILAFQCLKNEAELDDFWHLAQFMADHVPNTADRVWYRTKRIDEYAFVSLDPAQTKTTPPDDGVIVDVPKGNPQLSCRQILESVVNACESYSPPMYVGENELLGTAKRLLARENGSAEASFKSDIRAAMECSDQTAFQTALDDLYHVSL